MVRISCHALIALLLFAAALHAQVPRSISFQGVLTDGGGAAVPDGNYQITCRIYDAATGGVSSWSETHSAQTVKGVFSITLGANTPLKLLFDHPLWVGIAVDAGGEMSPRIPLSSVAYSLRAARADSADNALSIGGYTVSTTPRANALLPLDASGKVPISAIPSVPAAIPDRSITQDKLATGQVVTSVNMLRDSVTLMAGSNVSISGSGNAIVISATPGGGGGDITAVNTAANSGLSGGAQSGDVELAIQVPLSLNHAGSSPTILAKNTTGTGLRGESINGHAVHGNSENNIGVAGFSLRAIGIAGESGQSHGMQGMTASGNHAAVTGVNSGNGNSGYIAGIDAGVLGSSTDDVGVSGISTNNNGVYGKTSAPTGMSAGVLGESTARYGVFGVSTNNDGVRGQTEGGNSSGVYGITFNATGYGVFGENINGNKGRLGSVDGGVSGSSGSGYGVKGECTTGIGVHGTSASGSGVFGQSVSHEGVQAKTENSNASALHAWNKGNDNSAELGTPLAGLSGLGTNGDGVRGDSKTSDGVVGLSETTLKSGVYGRNTHAGGYGVFGANYPNSTSGYVGGEFGAKGKRAENEGYLGYSDGGVVGKNVASGYYGYLGMATRAAYFSGNVEISGALSKSSGSFKIDHPLDPANKYLYHSFVESPDMKNVYDGIVVLDGNGEGTVRLPAYFDALNSDFRYQLTCVGAFAPVHISREIANNEFRIAGGTAGLKVSWQVTGIRKDPYARAHPIVTEVEKEGDERGRYLHPVEHNKPGVQRIEPAGISARSASSTDPAPR